MKIALDYDGTVTESFDLWASFVSLFREGGHDVRIVTFRGPEDSTNDLVDFAEYCDIPIIFTSRVAKKIHCQNIGWEPTIWIDDTPSLITNPSEWTDEELVAWRSEVGIVESV